MSIHTVEDRAPTARIRTDPEPAVEPEGYTPLTHPDDVCARPFCLAEPMVSANGRITRWTGRHRWRVQPMALDWGVAVETSAAVQVDDDPQRVVIHVRMIDMDAEGDEPGHSFELELTQLEAKAFAASLTRSAEDVRLIVERRKRDATDSGGTR